jgi:Arc/MetJ-type ribon-helix-helix transcriptional regulator
MARKKLRTVQRRGRPLTLYLRQEQAVELDTVSRNRRVSKSELVRFALDRLLMDLRDGQMIMPLGLENL